MKFTKVAIVFVFLLSVCAFVLTAFLSTIRENEKEKRIALQGIRVQLEEKVKVLEEEKSNYQKQVDSLNSQLKEALGSLDENRSTIDQLRAELGKKDQLIEEKKRDSDELERAIQLSQERNRELEEALEGLERMLVQKQKVELETTGELKSPVITAKFIAPALPLPPVSVSENKPLSKKFSSNVKPIMAQEVEKPTAEKKEEVEPKLPKEKTTGPFESLQAGRVLLVNRKFNFIVINIGSKQGLKVGDAFMVLDGTEKVARVEIEKLYDDFAAAKIIEQYGDKTLLKEGNLVTRL